MKKNKRGSKLTKKELIRRISEIKRVNSSATQALQEALKSTKSPSSVRPWKPEDGVIMEGQLQPEIIPSAIDTPQSITLNGLQKITENTPVVSDVGDDDYVEKSEGRVKAVNGVTVAVARKAMEDAHEAPWQGFSYSNWKDERQRQEILYAFSKLSFWQKIHVLLHRRKGI